MWTWNEFLLALVVVSDEHAHGAARARLFQGRNTTDYSLLAAAGVIVRRIPVLFSRYVVPPAAAHPRHVGRGGPRANPWRRVSFEKAQRFECARRRGVRLDARHRRRRVHGAASGRPAAARRPRCGCSPGSRRSPAGRIYIGDRVVNDVGAARTATSRWCSRTTRCTRT